MAPPRVPTRQRIVNTALELFARQGITETTTRQIAEQAEINEVTLFRHFGNKHGLLLAVLEECLQKYLLLTQAGESLIVTEASSKEDLSRFLHYYIQSSLQALERVPELMRSLVGEAGQYPIESRCALAQGISQVNQSIASALGEVVTNTNIELPLPPLKLANLVNTCILGYAVMILTTEAQGIWVNREEFIATLVEIVAKDVNSMGKVVDIPAETVRQILLSAKRQGVMEYAIAYVLFGTGLTSAEIVNLHREDCLISNKATVLRIGRNASEQRLVPVNHKILGHRYGSATHNPLTNYLKTRKDQHGAMFLGANDQPLHTEQLQQLWTEWVQADRDRHEISLEQAQHTWGIEMLMRGMDVDNFQIISGLKPVEVQLYQKSAREKAAINQAIALDA